MNSPSEQCWALHNARINVGDSICLIHNRSKKGVVTNMGPNHAMAIVRWNDRMAVKNVSVKRINKI